MTFLKRCKNLSTVYLFGNNLKEINLTPLKYCPKLMKLNLHDNNLTNIDLTPLESCKELKVLWMHNNYISSIDLTPLTNLPELIRIGIDKSVDLKSSTISKELGKILEYPDSPRLRKKKLE